MKFKKTFVFFSLLLWVISFNSYSINYEIEACCNLCPKASDPNAYDSSQLLKQ